eukprot:TRINITY_DN1775_c2_g1_i1.p1 TRINITY_DN1775_c2_g1~~TRINITY_DN1775_c2_g1_i1.p1  ORF type:complete len:550 (-),score=176.40 TRINITY_DN1775_c2_g1_i1:5-1654(-)
MRKRSLSVGAAAAANADRKKKEKRVFKAVSKSNKESKLLEACSKGNVKEVQLYLKKGASLYCRDEGTEDTPLHVACDYGQPAAASALLQKGMIPNLKNAQDKTPIHLAVLSGHLEAVKAVLLTSQAVVQVNEPDKTGLSAIQYCMELDDLDCFRFLLEYGANINYVDEETGEGLLHYAVQVDFWKGITLLVDKGLNVNQMSKLGNTPLHLAAQFGLMACSAALLSVGSSTLIRNRAGLTAADLAKRGNHFDIEQMIEDHKNVVPSDLPPPPSTDYLNVPTLSTMGTFMSLPPPPESVTLPSFMPPPPINASMAHPRVIDPSKMPPPPPFSPDAVFITPPPPPPAVIGPPPPAPTGFIPPPLSPKSIMALELPPENRVRRKTVSSYQPATVDVPLPAPLVPQRRPASHYQPSASEEEESQAHFLTQSAGVTRDRSASVTHPPGMSSSAGGPAIPPGAFRLPPPPQKRLNPTPPSAPLPTSSLHPPQPQVLPRSPSPKTSPRNGTSSSSSSSAAPPPSGEVGRGGFVPRGGMRLPTPLPPPPSRGRGAPPS